MNLLSEEEVEENIKGKMQVVLHYKSNCYCKKGQEQEIFIESPNLDDTAMLERLFCYAVGASYLAKQEENGGWTQPKRTNGSHSKRNNGEIFKDVYIGKIAEIALYKYLSKYGEAAEPNLTEPGGYGNSDTVDMLWENKHISIKCTQKTSNLMLLQTGQYDEKGCYLPNIKRELLPQYFDYHVLCKYEVLENSANWESNIKFAMKDIITESEMEQLKVLMDKLSWKVRIVGYLSHDELVNNVIQNGMIVYADDPNNGLFRSFGTKGYSARTCVDVDNYYVQTGDLHPIRELTRQNGKVKYVDKDTAYAYICGDDGQDYAVNSYVMERTQNAKSIFEVGNSVSYCVRNDKYVEKMANYIQLLK